jgi:hypothetical protein
MAHTNHMRQHCGTLVILETIGMQPPPLTLWLRRHPYGITGCVAAGSVGCV